MVQKLRGEVKFKCLLCHSKTLYKERSMKKHRTDKICKQGQVLIEKILSGAKLDPPLRAKPLSKARVHMIRAAAVDVAAGVCSGLCRFRRCSGRTAHAGIRPALQRPATPVSRRTRDPYARTAVVAGLGVRSTNAHL